ncbi:LysR family transcriptional regulator [Pseudomonas sp. 10S4]|uniref:LysR family transcriptional regulator n=1 Tax=Pseudomonas sp. 10S4 TaxID=3048583 RepID=UPI002AC99DE1|nr:MULTISPECIES: LysR family transcriptional regulator [unclassified Pseudomonas]MEB0223264.1 LysR family transcriptional regulator [Pseudomonas sp. 5S1]MEB0294341.1 LysR family transcriptional regulator [Pseudomonas sp. 10S4]WPX18221.1 LysR family transcriptional regulator [Pseudomonas sp. 10S4]
MQKMGLLELNAVVAVSTHRSFRRAADELGMSPSAMSHAIAALEQRMGVRLFNRTTRSVSLSEAGEQFLARVRPALHEISAAMEAVNQFRDTPSGTLRINATEGAVQMLMTPVVVEFLKRYPDMRLDIVTDTALVDIVADGFDAGIRLSDSVPLDMIAVPCSPPLKFAVVGSPDYFARHPKPRSPTDLAGHSCIRTRFASGTLYRWEFEKRGQQQIIDVNGPLTLDSHQLIVDAALQGVGLACTNEHSIAGHLAAGRLIRVLQDWLPPYPGLCLYYPANRHVPAGLRAFIELVREVFGRKTAK